MFLLFYTRETNSSMHVGQFEVLLAELGPNQRRQRNDFRPGAMSGCVSEVKKKKKKYYFTICIFSTGACLKLQVQCSDLIGQICLFACYKIEKSSLV